MSGKKIKGGLLMKRVMAVIGLLALEMCFNPALLRADDTGTWHPFANLDYFGVGDAKQHAQDALNADCSQFAGPCSANVYGAEGLRVGMFRNMGGFDLGGSLGYLYGGPSISYKGTINDGTSGTGALSSTVNTIRLLAEARKTFSLSGPWSARIGAGAGWALDMENDSCSATGTVACTAGNGTSTANNGWLTWEISPSIAYNNYSLGLRYVGFARGGDVPWNTFGAFLGYEF
jgi:hypothetical protein